MITSLKQGRFGASDAVPTDDAWSSPMPQVPARPPSRRRSTAMGRVLPLRDTLSGVRTGTLSRRAPSVGDGRLSAISRPRHRKTETRKLVYALLGIRRKVVDR